MAKSVEKAGDYSGIFKLNSNTHEYFVVYSSKPPFCQNVEYSKNSNYSGRIIDGVFRSDSYPNELTFSMDKEYKQLRFMDLPRGPTLEWKDFIKSILPAIEFVERTEHPNIKRPEQLRKMIAEIKHEEAKNLEGLLRTVGENVMYFIKDVHNSVSIGIRKG